MLAQSFHFAAILIVAYLHKHFSSASSIGTNAVDHITDSSHYLCAATLFSNKAVEINRQVACAKLHDVDPIGSFPAQLEDHQQFDGAPDALFVWPILDEKTLYKTGVPGKMRIVIDLDCNLAGLMIRHDNTPQRCIRLSGSDEVDSSGPDLDVYTGYNCSSSLFSSTYVEKSLEKAINIYQNRVTKYHTRKFPKLQYCSSSKQSILLWPLLVDHTVYKPGESALITRMYFVEFSENRKFKKVRDADGKTCSELKTNILPEPNAKSLAHTHHRNKGMRQRALCLGQNFSGSYISLNKEKAIRAYAEIFTNQFKKYKYPRHSFQSLAKLASSSWMWPLRRLEKVFRRNDPVVSYILVFTGSDTFKGVFYWYDGKLHKCQLEDEVDEYQQDEDEAEESRRDESSSNIDLNKSLGCGECWNSEGCVCSQKNQKEMTQSCSP